MKKSIFFLIKKITAISCTFLIATFLPTNAYLDTPFTMIAKAADKVSENAESTPIGLNTTSTNIVIDDSYTLRVYNTQAEQTIICKSSDSKIVTIKASEKSSSAFILKGKKCGTAEVTIRIREGLSTIHTLKCEVNVGLPAISVSFTRAKVRLSMDGRTSLKTILKPSDTVEDPVYISSDTNIAYVSKKGTVIAKSIGECTITAYINKKDEDGERICDSCKIIVTEKDNIEQPEEEEMNSTPVS